MSNVASTYSDLGRHNDALVMQEKVLEFDLRVLPENHPDIGKGHVWYVVWNCMCFNVTRGFCLMYRYSHGQHWLDVLCP
jgi:hypothetical protein